MVYEDQFNTLSTSNWSFQDSSMWLGGYRLPEHAVVNNGTLSINHVLGNRALHPAQSTTAPNGLTAIEPSQWESAHMWTEQEFNKGYFEARVKYAQAPSVDHGFWLMPYPVGPEIDINEGFYKPNYHDLITHHIHARQEGSAIADYTFGTEGIGIYEPQDLSADFHTYAVDWSDEQIIWYFDGVETLALDLDQYVDNKNGGDQVYIKDYFENAQMRMRLSTAVSDAFSVFNAGDGVPDSADGTSMEVDYVRVFKARP